jgi:hypothetical protein
MGEQTLKKIAKATAMIALGVSGKKPNRESFNRLWQLIAAAIMQVVGVK